MKGYDLIKEYYGTRVAKRSGIPLMNHIDEGLKILDTINSSYEVKEAFCLHPLLQNNEEFENNYDLVVSTGGLVTKSILLAMEYRHKANTYLCKKETDHWTVEYASKKIGHIIHPVKEMLIADKVQNFKDFKIYHKDTHKRSHQLSKYFKNWLTILEISDTDAKDLEQVCYKD